MIHIAYTFEEGLLVGYLMRLPQFDPLLAILGIVVAAVDLGVGWFLCWDIGKTSIDDLPKIGWVIIFFIMPIISWVAYWLVVKKK